MTDHTVRLSLPLLHAAQAQKETTHNEALTRIDLLLHGCVIGVAEDTPPVSPPADPAPGACWIVGDAPTGAWAGMAGHVAGHVGGGWRFVAPREGMALWWTGGETIVRFRGGAWRIGEVRASRVIVGGLAVVGEQRAAIPTPEGGNTIDVEARTTLSDVLEALRGHGLIAV